MYGGGFSEMLLYSRVNWMRQRLASSNVVKRGDWQAIHLRACAQLCSPYVLSTFHRPGWDQRVGMQTGARSVYDNGSVVGS